MEKNKIYTIRKAAAFVLAAALIMAMSVTAYATELFGLWDLAGRIGAYEQVQTEESTQQSRYYISGFADSAESKAYAEWMTLYWNLPVVSNREAAAYDGGLQWYGCFSQTAVDGLRDIAEKYGLQLHDEIIYTHGGYRFPGGAFKEELYYVPENQGPILMSISNLAKGYLPSFCISVGNPEDYATQEYTTSTGQQLVFAYISRQDNPDHLQKFLMFADLGTSIVVVHGSGTEYEEGELPLWENHHITVENLKQIAEAVDFAAVENGLESAEAYDEFCAAIGVRECPASPRKIVSWSAEAGYSAAFVD